MTDTAKARVRSFADIAAGVPAAPPVAPSNEARDRVVIRALFHELTQAEASKLHTLLYSDEQGGYGSPSEADFALFCFLARGTPDAAQIERIARTSPRCRDKWDAHRSYLARSIENALTRRHSVRPAVEGEAEAPDRWQLLTSEQFLALPEPPWLVKDLLFASGFTLLYGQKGSYKSFVAYSLAQAIGRGQPWLGARDATRGLVVYVVAEGKGYFGRRITAAGTPPGILHATVPVNLFAGEGAKFAECVRAQLGDESPVLFVFDTLARSMVGGEENSNSDMMVVVDAAQRLQQDFNAAVLLVHHTGKDGLSERGGSALRAAADIVLKLEKTGARTVTLHFENTKDLAEPDPQGLVLEEREQSLIVVPASVVTTAKATGRGRTNAVAERRDKIIQLCVTQPRSKADLCDGVGIGERTLEGDLKVLQDCTPPRLKRAGGTGAPGDPFLYAGAGLRPQDTM